MSTDHEEGVKLRGSSGIALLGKQIVVQGKDLHRECLDLSFVAYTYFSVTGRIPEVREARVFEELWISTGYSDPRIWCNRIAGYMGSARVDPALSLSASGAACNSMGYGFGAMRASYRLHQSVPKGELERSQWLAAQLASRRVLHGYGRPIYGKDERIAYALRTLAKHGYRAGPALHQAFWLDDELKREKGITLNISGLWGAIGIDFGLSEDEYAQFMLFLLAPGYLAVYGDQRKRPACSFLPEQQSERGEA